MYRVAQGLTVKQRQIRVLADGDCVKMKLLLESFSLIQHVDSPTHSAGGILDVVIACSDCNIDNLVIDPPSISDHGLITCTIPFACPASPVFTSRRVRGWKRLDRESFRAALLAGSLCQDDEFYEGMSAAELFDLYNETIRATLDQLAPLHDTSSRYRPSTPWFIADCRSIRRGVRLLERRYRRTKSPTDRLAWINALREKHSVFKSKENSYWENTVKANSSNPKKLWQSVSTILGNPANRSANLSSFSASDFLAFLEQKVESVRTDTAGSAPPVFTSTTCSFTTFTLCSQEMVQKGIGSSAAKSCDLDPAPTFLIKEFLDPLLPFLTRLCNVSLQEGRLPSTQTTAIVTIAST